MDFGDTHDYSTLNRFRNRLIKANKLPLLLDEVNRQLKANNLMVAKTKVALLDATLITSAARPKTEATIEVATSEDEPPTVQRKTSTDPEASWVKK